MTDTDRFFAMFGKVVSVACALLTFAMAITLVSLLVEADRSATQPTFTTAPDSSHVHPRIVK